MSLYISQFVGFSQLLNLSIILFYLFFYHFITVPLYIFSFPISHWDSISHFSVSLFLYRSVSPSNSLISLCLSIFSLYISFYSIIYLSLSIFLRFLSLCLLISLYLLIFPCFLCLSISPTLSLSLAIYFYLYIANSLHLFISVTFTNVVTFFGVGVLY